MELAEFYRAVLPPEGDYALFQSGGRGRHWWADTQARLVSLTEEHSAEDGLYFATGSFSGRKRTQATVTGKQCFYLDIDAGAEKYAANANTAYATLDEALRAVVEFRDKFLRPTIIVASGGGLHVYWALDQTLDGATWREAAERFKRATKASGLKADPTSTADSARILRPPGTRHKSGAVVQVLRFYADSIYSLGAFNEALAPLIPKDVAVALHDALPPVIPVAAQAAAEVNDDFKKFDPVPTSAHLILPDCGAMREVAETQGNVVEPQWRGMIGVVKHCVEGAPLVHEWSKGYPGYDYHETQEKFDRYKAGPTTCETFAAYSSACATCPHWHKIKSPIVLGRIPPTQSPSDETIAPILQDGDAPASDYLGLAIPDAALGEGYRVTAERGRYTLSGQLVKWAKDPRGGLVRNTSWVKFTEDIFWLNNWTEAGNGDSGNSCLSLILLRGKRVQSFELGNEQTAERRTLLRFLAGKAINPLNHESETVAMMHQYINDQIRRVKAAAAQPVVRDHLGFHMNEYGDLYCAQGEYVINKDGSILRATLGHGLDSLRDAMIIESLPPSSDNSWGPTVWADVAVAARRQVAFYKKWFGDEGMEVAQLAIMMQLASPLLVFAADTDMQPGGTLPSAGLTVSLYSSESAKGKTSIQVAASYAFGDAGAMIRQGDRLGMTINAQVATAAALGTMPFPMDEVTNNDQTQVSETINRIASGIEKTRSKQDGSVARAPHKWALISTVSTNVPQRELVAEFQKSSDALQMRLIELDCDRLPTRRLEIVPEYDAALRAAMTGAKGSLGALIHLYCCTKGYAYMRKLVMAKTTYVAKLTPGESKERFILRGVAAMLVLQDILTELKLVIFATTDLEREVIAAFASARRYSITTTDPTESFLRMVRDLAPGILVTAEDIPTDDTMLVWENDRGMCRPPYTGRFCRKSQTLYLAEDECKKWAIAQQLSPTAVIGEAIKANLIVDFEPGRVLGQLGLARGIRGIFMPKQRVYRVNAAALKLPDVIAGGTVRPLHRATESQASQPAPGHSSEPRRRS